MEGAWSRWLRIHAARLGSHVQNIGDQPSHMLIATMPSGFETFFARCTEEFAKPGGPDMARIIEIGVEHGIHFML